MKRNMFKLAATIGSAVALGVALCGFVSVKRVRLPEGFTVTAHTGCEKTKDNSLEAITLGFGYGADIVEFDLNYDVDGVPVLSHDLPKNRDCVTLDEAFALVSGYNGLKVNVDVKSAENLAAVIQCAEKHGIKDRIFFTGIEKEKVASVRRDAPGIIYFLNTSIDGSKRNDVAYVNGLIEEIKSLGACGINMHHKNCSPVLVEEFHKNGLLVSVWTVNKKSDMKRMLNLGVDNITTRKIKDLKDMLAVVTVLD